MNGRVGLAVAAAGETMTVPGAGRCRYRGNAAKGCELCFGCDAEGANDPVGGLLATLENYDSPIDMRNPSERYGMVPTRMADFVHGVVGAAQMS